VICRVAASMADMRDFSDLRCPAVNVWFCELPKKMFIYVVLIIEVVIWLM
jgi:hypothetical protein